MVNSARWSEPECVESEDAPAEKKGETPMHDLLIALSFVIILLAPCFIASRAESSEETA
jgi:hypothetical protein